jgi:hypothetical protein
MAAISTSMLRVVSNSELDRQAQAERDRAAQEAQANPLLIGITGYMRACWDAARMAKQPIETQMLKALRQRNGRYEADKLAKIRAAGGSEVYMMITEVKCRAAESWLRDILLDTGEPPWDLEPTPLPDLDPEQQATVEQLYAEQMMMVLQQSGVLPNSIEAERLRAMMEQEYRFELLRQAQDRADRMKNKISDQLTEGGWIETVNEFITDLVTFPCAFIKGPVVRRQRTLAYSKQEDGSTVIIPEERLAPEYERVDPFRIFPEPGITHVNDGYLFEHHKLSRTDLADLIGVTGYDSDAIRLVLESGPGASWVYNSSELQKEDEEKKYNTAFNPNHTYDALEFWGKVSGKMLREWGMSNEEVPDDAKEYDANVWLVGSYVIKAVLNSDPLGEKPYTKTSFIKTPGAFWGRGIPEIIEDVQNVCNAATRALVNNMGIASGPQVEINVDRIPPNENVTQMYPWKIWQVTNDPLGIPQPAVRFFQPNDNSTQLMAVYQQFSKLADDHSGIPAYIYGDTDVKGAGRTASGLSMLMGSAGKGIRQVIMHIDNDIIRKVVQRQFVYNMRFDDDQSIKGDVRVIAKGVVNLAVKETVNMRRLEFLNATGNPIDMQIVGVEGRATLLREIAKGLSMPVDDIVPSREKLQYNMQLQQQQQLAAPEGQGAPAAKPDQMQPDGSKVGEQRNNLAMNQNTGGTT